MKKIFTLLFIFLLIIVFVRQVSAFNINDYLYYSQCKNPIGYKIDIVDPKFGVSKEEFLENTNKAAEIWNNALGVNIFTYDPEGTLSINFIYDKRQDLNTQINNLEGKLEKNEDSLKVQVARHKKESEAFRSRLASLNAQIEEWNNKGGAPPDEYNRLKTEEENLQTEADRLNEQAAKLNLSAENYNSGVSTLNNTIQNFNSELAQKPEEGVFIGGDNRIEIYFNNTEKELIHTIAHELGHAKGLDHEESKASIMYAFSTEDITPGAGELDRLSEICRPRSLWERFTERVNTLLNTYNLQYRLG